MTRRARLVRFAVFGRVRVRCLAARFAARLRFSAAFWAAVPKCLICLAVILRAPLRFFRRLAGFAMNVRLAVVAIDYPFLRPRAP